jgi:hypothetical protein
MRRKKLDERGFLLRQAEINHALAVGAGDVGEDAPEGGI